MLAELSIGQVLGWSLITLALLVIFLLVVYTSARLAAAGWFRSKRQFYERFFHLGGKEKG